MSPIELVRAKEEEIEYLRIGQGVIFTHNHPRGWGYPESSPLRGGGSFSDTDVRFACQAGLAGVRVVTPRDRYFMRPSAQGWSRDFWDALLGSSYTHHEADVRRHFRLLLARKQVTAEEAGAETAHEVWTRGAAEWGLTYGREQEG